MQSGSSSGGGDDQPTRAGGVPLYKVARKQRPATLRLVKGPGSPKDFLLELEESIVGRGLDAHIFIDSDSVSRKHAVFERKDGVTACRDLGSRNGIFVNGSKIQSAELHDGDAIQIGDALFMYRDGN